MASNSELQTDILQWMRTELPSLPPPRPETLSCLTEHPSSQALFHFLTTRVHTASTTASIRAALLLSSSTPTSSESSASHQAALATVRAQIAQVEQQLASLTTPTHPSGYDAIFSSSSVSASAARRAAVEALHLRTEHRAAAAAQAAQAVISPRRAHARAATLLANMARDAAQQAGADAAFDATAFLTSVRPILLAGSVAVSGGLSNGVRLAARRRVSSLLSSDTGTIRKDNDDHAVARDRQLGAATLWRKARLHTQEMKIAADDLLMKTKENQGAAETARALCAELEGERASLKAAEQPVRMGERAGARRRAEMRQRWETVKLLEDAVARTAAAARAAVVRLQARPAGPDVVAAAARAVRCAHSVADEVAEMLGKVEAGHERVSSDGGMRDGRELQVEKMNEDEMGVRLRAEEVRRVGAEWKVVDEALRERAEVAVESRCKVVAGVQTEVAREATKAADAAKSCRESEAVAAQREMQTAVSEDGAHAAPWLLGRQLQDT